MGKTRTEIREMTGEKETRIRDKMDKMREGR